MQQIEVNGYAMSYLEVGQGKPQVMVHGSLGDFRTWTPVLGPLSRQHRLIAVSLRHFFPEYWNGKGGRYTIAQHVADTIAFIEKLDCGPVNLIGHSRGGHIAFRVAGARPDLLNKVILAEPGGELDASLTGVPAGQRGYVGAAAEKIAAGDVEGGLIHFIETIDGPGAWQRQTPSTRQRFRDNAGTLIGQVNEQRAPYTRAEAEAIRTPSLFIGGANTQGSLARVLRTLSAHVPGAKVAMIDDATHSMFEQNPVAFAEAVNAFLAEG